MGRATPSPAPPPRRSPAMLDLAVAKIASLSVLSCAASALHKTFFCVRSVLPSVGIALASHQCHFSIFEVGRLARRRRGCNVCFARSTISHHNFTRKEGMNRLIHSLLRPFALSDRQPQPPICRRRRIQSVSSPWRRLGGGSGDAIGRTFRNRRRARAGQWRRWRGVGRARRGGEMA